ncbi:MAG: hypothetical protein NTV24_04820 [Candidatus Woesebacteria bacterium]|nr:hypothetical protein [Candidatus Woesebacteria bacterium]
MFDRVSISRKTINMLSKEATKKNIPIFDKEMEENIQIDALCRLIIRSYMREKRKTLDKHPEERCITNLYGN